MRQILTAMRRPLSVEQCVAESRMAVPHLSMSSRRGCSWNQRSTRVSSSLARAFISAEGSGALFTGVLPTFQGYRVQGWFKFVGMEKSKTRFAMEMSEQDAWKNREFITLGGSAVAEFVTEVFLCTYEACSIRYVSDPSHANGMLATGQKLVAENDVANGLYSDVGPMLSKQTPHHDKIQRSTEGGRGHLPESWHFFV